METVVGLLIIAAIAEAVAIAILRRRIHENERSILRLAVVRRQQGEIVVPPPALIQHHGRRWVPDEITPTDVTETD